MAASCIFCKIVAKQLPAKTVYEDDAVVAFHDLNPDAKVHILVVPKQHVENVVQLADNAQLLAKVVQVAGQIAKERAGGEFKLLFNTGKSAGQSVFHAHGHIMSNNSSGGTGASANNLGERSEHLAEVGASAVKQRERSEDFISSEQDTRRQS
jgi:histidine triad (HIT) family protein